MHGGDFMKKKVTLLTLILVLAMSAIGCGVEKQDIGNVLSKSQESTKDVKSVSCTATMNMKMSSGEESMDVNYAMNMDMFSDPMKAKVGMTIDMGALGTTNTTLYMMANGDEFGTYTEMEGAWYKSTMDKAAFEEAVSAYDNSAYMDALAECEDSLKMSEVEESGKKYYKIEGTLTGDAIKKMMDSTNLKDQLSSLGSEVDMSSLENMGGMTITALIEKEGYKPYKMTIDMKDMMKGIMESAMKAAGSEETVTVDNCVMDMEYVGFDSAEDFELPEEAKNAQEVAQ